MGHHIYGFAFASEVSVLTAARLGVTVIEFERGVRFVPLPTELVDSWPVEADAASTSSGVICDSAASRRVARELVGNTPIAFFMTDFSGGVGDVWVVRLTAGEALWSDRGTSALDRALAELDPGGARDLNFASVGFRSMRDIDWLEEAHEEGFASIQARIDATPHELSCPFRSRRGLRHLVAVPCERPDEALVLTTTRWLLSDAKREATRAAAAGTAFKFECQSAGDDGTVVRIEFGDAGTFARFAEQCMRP